MYNFQKNIFSENGPKDNIFKQINFQGRNREKF